MWTGILLACSLEGGCVAVAGPAFPTEAQCLESIPYGWLMLEENYPHMIVKDAICYSWGEDA